MNGQWAPCRVVEPGGWATSPATGRAATMSWGCGRVPRHRSGRRRSGLGHDGPRGCFGRRGMAPRPVGPAPTSDAPADGTMLMLHSHEPIAHRASRSALRAPREADPQVLSIAPHTACRFVEEAWRLAAEEGCDRVWGADLALSRRFRALQPRGARQPCG
ncbi:hypothetical protein ACE1OA_01060 [Streptomyces sp. JL2001]|uniref:hypothetical protein n=1 Tax=Streptomyces sp. JL2001 TaxID=3342488 RepID=UPI003D809E04